jgi:homoserine kinase
VARPAFRAGSAHVRVPATSANLGPGFDAFGLALDLHDDVLAVIGEDGIVVDVAGEGADEVARNMNNLVVTAMRATFDELGGQPRGIEISCANRIPHGRGLGSSAAAIVAGVLLARALVLGGDQALGLPAVLELASQLEGHPDNVAACLLGGLTIAWSAPAPASPASKLNEGSPIVMNPTLPAARTVSAVRVDLDPAITPFVFVPTNSSSTRAARQALPDTVPHADAAYNAARSALLIAALSGVAHSPIDEDSDDPADTLAQILFAATDDKLHQRYRSGAMTATADLVGALRNAGISAVVSGAGPSVLAFTRTDAERELAADNLPAGWSGTALGVDRVGAHLVAAQR